MLSSLLALVSDVWRFRRGGFTLAGVLLLVASLMEGAGLAALVPVLNILIGSDYSASRFSGIERSLSRLASALGLPLGLPFFLAVALALFVIKGALVVVQSRVFYDLLFSYELAKRRIFLDRYLKADWRYIVKQDPGRVAAFLNSQTRIIAESTYYLNYLVNSLVFVLVLFGVAAYFSPILAVAALVMFGGALLVMRGRMSRNLDFGVVITNATENLSSRVVEILANTKTVKAQSLEAEVQRSFIAEAEVLAHAQRSARVNDDVSAAIVEPLIVLALMGVMTLGVYALGVTSGTLLMFLATCYRMLPRVSYIQSQYQKVLVGVPALRKLDEKLDEIAIRTRERAGMRHLSNVDALTLKFDTVSFAYDSARPLLRDISFCLESGEHICITGPSGTGKSTIVDLVLGLVSPDSGRILVNGIPLANIYPPDWHGMIGFVGQETILWNDTIYNNLRWGDERGQVDRNEAESLLTRAGLEDLLRREPSRSDARVGDRGSLLSGGERQRFAVVRAILRRPRLLILDEATSAIDEESERRILTLVIEWLQRSRCAVISVAHNSNWIVAATRAYVVRDRSLLPRDAVIR